MNSNTVFWFGVVEDRLDPLEIGRVRVRVLNYHPEDKNLLATEKLPWAVIVQPTTSSSISGKGISNVGFVEGTWVVGFFADGENAQVPVVIGSLTGLNDEIKKGENFGDGFRDSRSSNDLKIFPVDTFKKQEYPDGKKKSGDQRGAQLQNEDKSSNYPREMYSAESSGRNTGTPDLNILAINDPNRIKETIVQLKRKNLRDAGVPVADCRNTKFVCGVTGQSAANKGTIKNLGTAGVNGQQSSSFPSLRAKSKQFIDKPTNNNAIRVDSSKTMKLDPDPSVALNANVSKLVDFGIA